MARVRKEDSVKAIIEQEFEKAHARASARADVVLRKEFNRLVKKHPKLGLVRVLFGNGTAVPVFSFDDNRGWHDLPKSFDDFRHMCNDAAFYRYIAVVGSDLEVK